MTENESVLHLVIEERDAELEELRKEHSSLVESIGVWAAEKARWDQEVEELRTEVERLRNPGYLVREMPRINLLGRGRDRALSLWSGGGGRLMVVIEGVSDGVDEGMLLAPEETRRLIEWAASLKQPEEKK